MTRLVSAERERPAAELVQRLERNIAQVIRGKPAAIRNAVLALLARGHLLIEDVPGVGKTTLARALALSMGGSVLDSRGAGARKRGRLEPRGRPSLDGKATREDERATLDL